MGILNAVFGKESPMENEEPEIIQNKKYRLCIEDNPNERKYRCGKRDACSPACKLSLHLEELTHEEVLELELEIRDMLDRHKFTIR